MLRSEAYMMDSAITAALNLGKAAIERIWPDPLKRAEELRKLEELAQQGDLAYLDAHVKIMLAQIETNNTAAKHKSIFVAGARPAAIWAGVASMVWAGILHPLMLWGWAIMSISADIPEGVGPPPALDTGALTVLLGGLLGVAGMRSVDKKHNVGTNSLKN